AVAIAQPGLGAGDRGGEPAVARAQHLATMIAHQFDALRVRRPQPKGHAVRADQRAKTAGLDHGLPANARIAVAGAVSFAPGGSVVVSTSTEFCALSSTRDQRVTLSQAGRVTSMPSAAALNTTKSGSPSSPAAASTYARNRPSGKFQSSSFISAASGLS